MTYEEWWKESELNEEWRYADRDALQKAAFNAGIASRDAEVVSLTNQRDYEYVRAENAEQERDQLREQVKLAHIALVEIGQRSCCYKKSECIDGQTRYGKGSYEDDLNNAMGGTPWQTCHCFPESYFKVLAATEPKK